MGWTFTYGTNRRDIIEEITRPWTDSNGERVCLKHCTRGSVLWSVWENRKSGHRWIGCNLLRNGGKGYGWGHKSMCESMGPYYYSCPLSYLNLVPDDNEGVDPNWRAKVRTYYAEKATQRKKASSVEVGDTIALLNSTIPCATIVSTKPLLGDYGGRRYRIPKKMIGEVMTL